MTAEPVTVTSPKHPLYAMTTYELAHYRHELEHAVTVPPEHAAVHELLRRRLAEVLAEQQSRAAIAAAGR